MRRRPTDFYLMALRAFKRIHGYPARAGELTHDKWMAGWQCGYWAHQRKARRRG